MILDGHSLASFTSPAATPSRKELQMLAMRGPGLIKSGFTADAAGTGNLCRHGRTHLFVTYVGLQAGPNSERSA